VSFRYSSKKKLNLSKGRSIILSHPGSFFENAGKIESSGGFFGVWMAGKKTELLDLPAIRQYKPERYFL
jgi:hypothetical protein